jgi:hypothetical protein
MDSRIVQLVGSNGQQHAAGWLRTLAATGEFVYSGCCPAPTSPQYTSRSRVLRLHYRLEPV